MRGQGDSGLTDTATRCVAANKAEGTSAEVTGTTTNPAPPQYDVIALIAWRAVNFQS
jgi:hypothetical protein